MITIFAFFPRKCGVLGGQEEKKEMEVKGEGGRREGGGGEGSRVLDILDGQRASVGRIGCVMTLEGHLCSSMSNFVHDVASKMYVFQLKDKHFSPNRTLMLAGS